MRSIRISRSPDDPLCPRVSLGGKPEIGFYCKFRGTKKQAIEILEIALKALKEIPFELEIEEDEPIIGDS